MPVLLHALAACRRGLSRSQPFVLIEDLLKHAANLLQFWRQTSQRILLQNVVLYVVKIASAVKFVLLGPSPLLNVAFSIS